MFTKIWWQRVAERVVKAAAMTFTSLVGTDQLGIHPVDWGFVWYMVAVMSGLSFAGSILTTNIGPDKQDPSIT